MATAGSLQDTARDTARAKFSEQQKAAASGLDDIARALRNSAREMQEGDAGLAGRFADTAADGLDRLSQTLRSKDFDTVLRDVEGFARAQPAVFFGAAVAAGFLAMRFLKSSSPTTTTSVPTTEI